MLVPITVEAYLVDSPGPHLVPGVPVVVLVLRTAPPGEVRFTPWHCMECKSESCEHVFSVINQKAADHVALKDADATRRQALRDAEENSGRLKTL